MEKAPLGLVLGLEEREVDRENASMDDVAWLHLQRLREDIILRWQELRAMEVVLAEAGDSSTRRHLVPTPTGHQRTGVDTMILVLSPRRGHSGSIWNSSLSVHPDIWTTRTPGASVGLRKFRVKETREA